MRAMASIRAYGPSASSYMRGWHIVRPPHPSAGVGTGSPLTVLRSIFVSHDLGDPREYWHKIFIVQSSGCALIPPPARGDPFRAADPHVACLCFRDVLCAHAVTYAGSLAWQARGFGHPWRLSDTARKVRACPP